ncbi:Tautomerase MIF [Coniophora puteana RWD-64-598 SS2]|uniref:L-dopachrome isomerase n=1 Tax=Coniophora puteana (strain RWD-64-598) TaxID=741705 RepID=A0A5M3N3P0_CONPW|nr:Tautomerase MIF [Coniophora puteana RWD-64-598 SS2]EIW85511.1 Tautomerase MIF [Coniophora puteana RWD-64-598 SS2]
MPLVTLIHNVKVEDTRQLAVDFTNFISETVSKPVTAISLSIVHNPDFAFAATFEPACRLHIINLWNNSPENAVKWSAAFASFFELKLGVPKNRYHIAFEDPGPEYVGALGSTAAALEG